MTPQLHLGRVLTGTKDDLPFERMAPLASLNNQSLDFQLGLELRFPAFEQPTSKNQIRMLKVQTLALWAAQGRPPDARKSPKRAFSPCKVDSVGWTQTRSQKIKNKSFRSAAGSLGESLTR